LDEDHSWCADGCVDPEPRPGERKVLKGGGLAFGGEFTRISARKEFWNEGSGYNSAFGYTGVRCVRPATEDLPDAGPDSGM
jgi:hypothetical protein